MLQLNIGDSVREVLVKSDLKHLSLEEILENIDNIDFECISLDTSCVNTNSQGEQVHLLYTNDEYPISIGSTIINFSSTLFIDKNYYLNNKEYVDNLLKLIIEKRKKDGLELIGIELIHNDKIIDAVKNNSVIENISLRSIDSEYKLDNEMYQNLKKTGHIKRISTKGVVDELKENFDPIIACNSGSLYRYYSYKDLMNATKISASADINDMNNMFYLKYLNPNAIIDINFKDGFPLELFLENIEKYNIKNKIAIGVDDKNSFNRILFNNLDLFLKHDIDIKLGLNNYSLKTYIDYEKRLLEMIKPAMNLSPLERYLFAYNVVKKYKKYKENNEDKRQSRNVYELLDNDYMVCVGYASLLIDLLGKLGITCKDYGDGVNIGFDKNKNEDMVATENISTYGGHARVEVKIDDDKYNIHGIYIADPTWDNFMDNDSYVHALMTRKEHKNMNRENYFSHYFAKDLCDADSIEDFYMKVNYKLDSLERKEKVNFEKNINSRFKKCCEKLDNNQYFNYDKILNFILKTMYDKYNMSKNNQYFNHYSKEMLVKKIFSEVVDDYKFDSIICDEDLTKHVLEKCDYCYKKAMNGPEKQEYKVIGELLDYLKIFNSSLYNQIISKYPILNSYKIILNNSEISDIITTIGQYIVSVNNNYVSGDTIISAASELYRKSGLSKDEINEKIAKTIEFNKKYGEQSFPKRMRINPDGTEEVYMNPDNKFDIKIR